jgi:hypothetical protein
LSKSQIITPKHFVAARDALFKKPFKASVGLAGRYRFVVRSAETNQIVRETDWIDNIILTSGLNRLGTGGWYGFMHIGTGTATPVIGDTVLAAQSASTSIVQSNAVTSSGTPLYIVSRTVAYRFNAGVLNGNYTEVGIGWTSTQLFSRALILDGGGSPTSITVGITEYLDVYYELRLVPDLADYVTVVNISGTNYNVTRRVALAGNVTHWTPNGTSAWTMGSTAGTGDSCSFHDGVLGAVTSVPAGSRSDITSAVNVTYVGLSNKSSGTFTVALNNGNLAGGIKSFMIRNNVCSFQNQFDVNIPKDATKVMTLSAEFTWAAI